MTLSKISNGVVHKITTDIREALYKDPKALANWESLTPLARNEWICWITFVKKKETRLDHIKRLITDLNKGKRRPCCWIGCIHRTDKAISPSVKNILNLK